MTETSWVSGRMSDASCFGITALPHQPGNRKPQILLSTQVLIAVEHRMVFDRAADQMSASILA